MNQHVLRSTRVDAIPRTVAGGQSWRDVRPLPRQGTIRTLATTLMAAGELAALILVTLVTGFLYNQAIHASPNPVNVVPFAATVTVLFVVFSLLDGQYRVERVTVSEGWLARTIHLWTFAFAATLALAFLSRTTEVYSRVTTVLIYFTGLATVLPLRPVLRRIVLTSRRIGGAVRRRLLLVGTQERVDAFLSAQPVDRSLAHVIGAALVRPLPPEAEGRGIDDDAAMAAHVARFLEPDDVVVLLGAADGGAARRCINAFISLPCTLHLALPHELDLLARSVPQLAGVPIVRVLPQPLSTGQLALKRAFDIVASGVAIVLLLPLLALVAAAIAVDSRGPVLFTQRRYGFNWQPFRIYKFRTMTVAEDGRVVRQAVADDPRVTRVGRLLRRTNLDELPQLLNVLAGSMSLVGPRPHAMVHDQTFMARIGSYSCRHNVKPGITGWAQVNGYRGEIASDEDLLRRLEYDLDYIRRWSIWFDLKIIILTALSPRAFRNAR